MIQSKCLGKRFVIVCFVIAHMCCMKCGLFVQIRCASSQDFWIGKKSCFSTCVLDFICLIKSKLLLMKLYSTMREILILGSLILE